MIVTSGSLFLPAPFPGQLFMKAERSKGFTLRELLPLLLLSVTASGTPLSIFRIFSCQLSVGGKSEKQKNPKQQQPKKKKPAI